MATHSQRTDSTHYDLGVDADGDEHSLFAWVDETEFHKADSQCGCNPDPYHDEGYPARWWWAHHAFEPRPT